MLFNLNEFLMAVSFTLDFVEMDIIGVTTNHNKRVAYISLMMAKELGLSDKELYDIVALAILHDNGLCEQSLHNRFLDTDLINIRILEGVKEHCTIGEENVKEYPFLTDVKGVIKYHHEDYDGTGYFNLKGEQIPLMSQIIHLADLTDGSFHLGNSDNYVQNRTIEFVNEQSNKMFSKKLVDVFNKIIRDKECWMNLKDDNIYTTLKIHTPLHFIEMSLEEIRKITGVFSKIIDSKSEFTKRHSKDLSDKVEIMSDYYKKDSNEKMKLLIAADLHDIGKLAVPNKILDSSSKLTNEEFEVVKKHTYYTRIALQEISDFEDITEWASNHHEKLNGQGYPIGKTEKDIDFNSRLMACLDIYQALVEERPYRRILTHEEAMEILNEMKNKGFIDRKITEDIDYVFRNMNLKEKIE
jgi:HD-GYP domain-containing protein (c-di-GMP phosphodiesterase class II)